MAGDPEELVQPTAARIGGVMAKRKRKRARKNPVPDAVYWVATGALVVGVGGFIYWLATRNRAAPAQITSTTNTNSVKTVVTPPAPAPPPPHVAPPPPPPPAPPPPAPLTILSSIGAQSLSQVQSPCPPGFKWGGFDADNPNLPKCIPA
jgi:hypothetical protein